jgi:hypothetical protein
MNCTTYFGKIKGRIFRCDISLSNGKVIDCIEVDRYPYKGELEVFASIEAMISSCEGSEADW